MSHMWSPLLHELCNVGAILSIGCDIRCVSSTDATSTFEYDVL